MITSTANPRVKALAGLGRRSERDRLHRFPAEGARIVERALDAGWDIQEIVVAPTLATSDAMAVARSAAAHRLPVLEVGEAAFRKIAYRRHPDGVLAVVATRDTTLDALDLPERPLVLVVEGIEKPGNLGAMLRTADGVGVEAVVVADPATDVYNPNVVRASQGAVFTVPLAVAEAGAAAAWLSAHHIRVVAAAPGADSPPWQVDLAGAVAVVVGSEHAGLSATWAGCDDVVGIPMRGTADSLNAATAAAVLLYEALRQRS